MRPETTIDIMFSSSSAKTILSGESPATMAAST